jgi:outer membrane protein assembly factor BamD
MDHDEAMSPPTDLQPPFKRRRAPRRRRSGVRWLLVLAVAVGLAACETAGEGGYVEMPVEDLYNKAMDALAEGKYEDAATQFDEVERQHPYSVWATKAQLMAAFAHYISDVGRDQKMTELALRSLDEVATRFPESNYARDAQLKLDLTRDHLAGKEMEIGRYYQSRGYYLAGINRFRTVVEQYQTTTHVPEALHRLTESYIALGVTDEAQAAASILGYNFPGSEWYMDSYALLEGVDLRPEPKEDSWLAKLF